MINDILYFLPKYSNINKFDNNNLNPYIEDFYESTFLKKEFNDLKLEKQEIFPEKKGELFKHQKLMARFLSSYTLYDQMLLVHDMGTGKTCSAVAVIESIKNERNDFKGALYLAKGSALINNFIDELIFKCTDGRYVPENYTTLTELEKVHRKKKMINDFYNWGTFEIFAKEISRLSDRDIINKYSNHIIVIDEIHNIRIQKKDNDKIKLYQQFWRFLHIVKDCKILLLSGTPMKDGVDEIASVMNLILPLEKQLPTGEEFVDEYFDNQGSELYILKDNMKQNLYDIFKGRISYLRSMLSDVKVIYEGKKLGTLKEFNVLSERMSSFQTTHYKNALKIDKEDRKGIYTKSRQASLFVFPDGSYGEEGYKKYIKESSLGYKVNKTKKETKNFQLSQDLISQIKGSTNEESLKNLYRFSSKYAESIKNILKAHEQGKLVFVYNEYVKGSGLILFGKLLEIFGFNKASGKESKNSVAPRYASLTNMTSTTKQIKQLVDRFNNEDNMTGDIIGVIMGSRKISEGFSFRNIQLEEIHTPWFNYSETAQAIARGLRVGSHNDLIKSGINVELKICQRVSIPEGHNESIDLQMYETSEQKDMSIKSVIRVIKESAWDCALTYDRNYVDGQDGTRECDYLSCEYKCLGVTKELMESVDRELDISTYQLYYSDIYKNVFRELQDVFKTEFNITYTQIKSIFQDKYTNFEVLAALQKITNENISFVNKYGFNSYLREDNNLYFLIDNLSVKGIYLTEYYTKNPTISKNMTFNEIFEPIYDDSLPSIIQKLCKVDSKEEFSNIMVMLPKELQEYILESALLAQKKNKTENINIRVLILEYFDGNYGVIDGVTVSWYLYKDLEIIRYLDNDNEFKDSNNYDKKVDEYLSSLNTQLEENPYKVYGKINIYSNDFCIKDLRNSIPINTNERTSGRRCGNWELKDINQLIIFHLKLPIPDDKDINDKDLKLLNEKIRNNSAKSIQTSFKNKTTIKYQELDCKKTDFLNLKNEELERISFWIIISKESKCAYLKSWFESKKLIEYGEDCGTYNKKKLL